jgi:EAL domain-containing protein (putative c-di-GMP-specific phosphodiesterase class I)
MSVTVEQPAGVEESLRALARGSVGEGGPLPGGRILEIARRHLDMEVAFLAEFADGRQIYRRLAGDAASFGWELGDGPPLAGSYCRRMASGRLPSAIPDALRHPATRDLAVTAEAGIGSYIGVPVRLADGSLYGSLCCVSHRATPLGDRDVRVMELLAELISSEVQVERQQATELRRLRRLIDTDALQIAVQPIVELGTGRVCGVEALSRFPRDAGPTEAVFAAAHAAGVGAELERLALQRALELLAVLPDDRYLTVNLAPELVLELLGGRAELPDLPYERLVVEITEHAAVQNYVRLRDALAQARGRGLRLAIDDAGAGYASLHHIVELAPDIIKVDRSLVDGIAADRGRRGVVRAFVALAVDLGATVVAEGVERLQDLAAVREVGVPTAQGYLLGRPSVDLDQLADWLAGPLGTDAIQLP